MSATESESPAPKSNSIAWREYHSLQRLVLWAIAICCAVSLSMNLADPDLWGHVRYGQDLLADGKLPATATHTFTARDHRWINHENLAEITFATLFAVGGDQGLLIFKCLWGMTILGIMAWVARRSQVPPLAIAAMMMLIASNLAAFFPVRPQLLSYMWLALILLVLDLAFRGWHEWLADRQIAKSESCATGSASVVEGTSVVEGERHELHCTGGASGTQRQLWWLVLLPPLMMAWTNSHGAFVAGLAIVGAYLGGRIIEAIVYKRFASVRVASMIALAGGLTIAATLINPYGWHLHEWLLMSLGTPRPEITEWDPPKFTDPVFVPLVLLALAIIGSLALTRRKRDWVQIAILALVFWQACEHVRHISLLSILAGFWIPVHFANAAGRLRPTPGSLPVVQFGRTARWTLAAGLSVAIALQSAVLYSRVAKLPVYRNMYPVDAMAFMAEHDMSGRLVVSFNWAQYALAALSPQVEVSFDGRFRTCYPQEVIDRNFDFLLGEHGGKRHRSSKSGPVDGRQVLADGSPNLVLVDRNYEHAVKVMQQVAGEVDSAWTLLYQDGIAQLWGLREEFDDPNHSHYLPPDQRFISDHLSDTSVEWPALPHTPAKKSLASRERESSFNREL